MKKFFGLASSIVFSAFFLGACANLQLSDITDIFGSPGGGENSGGLATSEVIEGLKEALKVGTTSATDQTSVLDGFYKNPAIFIPLPPELKKVESQMRALGLGSLLKDFVKSLNRGAEKAAGLAKPIFISAVTQMTIQDAWTILRGSSNTAATQYLRRTTGPELIETFRPVVQNALSQVQATRYWGDLAQRYNSVPFVKPVRVDLDGYVTERATDGLFYLIAEEEKKIRLNPWDYASAILRRVFSTSKS
jgi:hypothetical protein